MTPKQIERLQTAKALIAKLNKHKKRQENQWHLQFAEGNETKQGTITMA